jgi:hypothetical protein
MFTNLNLTDMETGYKVFKREVIQSIKLEQNRFGFEPEVTVKISRMKLRIYEVGISYSGRTYEEGKKIGWKDGVQALWCILKYSLRPPFGVPYHQDTASKSATNNCLTTSSPRTESSSQVPCVNLRWRSAVVYHKQ